MKVHRRPKLRRPGYEPQHAAQLLGGFDWFGDAYGDPSGRHQGRRGGPFDEAAARADWTAHREELLAYWLQTPATRALTPEASPFRQTRRGGPGTRPAAWWWFEAPEPRRLIARWTFEGAIQWGRLVPLPLDAPGLDTGDWLRLWREEPRGRHFFRGIRNPAPGINDWETEREYLARLGLMSRAERAALPAEDPEATVDDPPLGYPAPDDDDHDDGAEGPEEEP
jgi:hypothetical protein